LCAIFDDNCNHHVPQAWRHLVGADYNKIPSHHCLDDGENPVVKRCLVVWEYEGSPHFDTLQEDESQDGGADAGRFLNNLQTSAQMSAMHSRLCSLEKQHNELRNKNREFQRQLMTAVQQVQRNVTRIAVQPVVRPVQVVGPKVGATGCGDGDVPYAVTLSPNPNNLYVLWQEYEHGVGGRKAARHFTRIERGHKRVKYTFCNRKKVWDLVDY
jgi:hypothetical protein